MDYKKLEAAVQFIQEQADFEPEIGIILGTGLSGLAEDIERAVEIPYRDIPHFPQSTVESHKGSLILGYLEGKTVVAMAGRFHIYEGYSMEEVVFPVRVMKLLGIRRLIISNAAGSTNADIQAGDLVFFNDHIDLMPGNPLLGINDEKLGPRFPDMSRTYDLKLNAQALKIAKKHGIRAHEGVYVALPGPSLETPAEYQFIHTIGGDLVGMSTVPEVIAARHMELPLFVVSVVSNQCYPLEVIQETTIEMVLEVVKKAESGLKVVVRALLGGDVL